MADSGKLTGQPALPELMVRFLRRQATALAPANAIGEVVPHEAVPAQPVDPRVAWNEAGEAIRCFHRESSVQIRHAPPDWSAVVAGQEPDAALAFCAGNFPQLVRDVHALLGTTDLSTLCPMANRPVALPALTSWASQVAQAKQFPDLLFALGACRLARQFEQAEELFQRHQAQVPAEWQAAWANEEAALAWHRGNAERATSLWQKQAPSAPVLFNRGMSALFQDRAKEARALLSQAVNQLPEDHGWHHLGKLYLALAEMRS